MRIGRRRRCSLSLAVALAAATGFQSKAQESSPSGKWTEAVLAEGGQIYGSRCILCHGRSGGRGPNLFMTSLSEDKFIDTIINGRKGTQMPAFGYVLSPDEVVKIFAFVKSRQSAF